MVCSMKTPESPDVAGPSGLATVAMPTREWLVCTAASGAVSFVAIEGSHVSETSRFMMDVSKYPMEVKVMTRIIRVRAGSRLFVLLFLDESGQCSRCRDEGGAYHPCRQRGQHLHLQHQDSQIKVIVIIIMIITLTATFIYQC
jgi:hypothetical protein